MPLGHVPHSSYSVIDDVGNEADGGVPADDSFSP